MYFHSYNKNNYTLLAFLYLSTFFYARINIDIGFSLKLFMIVSFLIFITNLKKFKFYLNTYDYIFILFIIYGSSTVIFSFDVISGLRMIFGSIIVLFCYFVLKFFLIEYVLSKKIHIHEVIIMTLCSFVFISLFSYLIGFFTIYGNLSSFEQETIFGITVERSMPRLVGLNYDPNINVFMSLIFFYYLYFYKNKNLLVYLLLFLITFMIILTISTAGIISVSIPLIFYYIYQFIKFLLINKYVISIRKLFLLLLVSILISILLIILNENEFILNILEKRINNLNNGSGRFEIWNNAITLFYQNQFFGIGWYNFLEYNKIIFNRENYMHNTFLEVLVELGIFGFLIYILFFIILFLNIIKLQYKKSNKYLLFTFFSMIILLNSLSLYINEVLFVFMALVSYELYNMKKIKLEQK